MSPPAVLSCPVRDCGAALAADEQRALCPAGHAFDRARSGYLHLLQPQSRRSRAPGDGPQAVAARERLADAGFDAALRAALVAWWQERELPAQAAVLDVGCGVGDVLARLVEVRPCVAFGLDLSVAAVRAAARRHPARRQHPARADARCDPGPTWIVDNADRRLPFVDGGLDALLSVKGPKNPVEFARVLRPGGCALVVVPAADDLQELRRATAGAALPRDPAERALAQVAEAGTALQLIERRSVREVVRLEPAALRDLLHVSYRGLRNAEAGRAEQLDAIDVTASAELLAFRRDA